MAWYPPTVTVKPTAEAVTLADAKVQTRYDGTANDGALNLFLAGAIAHVESYCGTPLAARTVTVKCDRFEDFIKFPIVPLGQVTSISYVDSAGTTQTLSTSVYDVRTDGLTASIALKDGQSWPSKQARSRITVTAQVGYSEIPADVRHAILLMVGHFDINREAVTQEMFALPMGVDALLANHRAY